MSKLKEVLKNREAIRTIVSECNCTDPILFGSVARQEETDTSDIDILITPTHKTSLLNLGKFRRIY